MHRAIWQLKKAESKGITVDPGEKKAADEVKKIVFACDAGMGSSANGSYENSETV